MTTLALGCSSSLDSSRYPSDLRYPLRHDLILKEELKAPPAALPPPGALDEAIRAAADKEVNKGAALDPDSLGKDDRDEIRTTLNEIFGTPARPRIEPGEPADPDAEEGKNRKLFVSQLGANLGEVGVSMADIDDLKLDEAVLRRGSTLYRKHCLHCHGLAGDGRGPTGPWVHPHPRDYRRGQFKFVSTSNEIPHRKPRRQDLHRTLAKGIDGTSMPAFGLLPAEELDAMVSYVIHLSIRGQTEQEVTSMLILSKGDKSGLEGESIHSQVYATATRLLAQWADANHRESIKPGDYTVDDSDKDKLHESVRKGYQLFLGKGGCMACHTDFGRQVPYRYDTWGTLVQPRNLTAGNYRGGRRPIDIYWRIAGGIEPSGMSAGKTLTEEERWDLVNFVTRLPYPAMLPSDIRQKVFRPSEASSKSSPEHASR